MYLSLHIFIFIKILKIIYIFFEIIKRFIVISILNGKCFNH